MAVIGIYEKALPQNISWAERFALVKKLGFDFMELSIDESDERLARLDWSEEEIKMIQSKLFASEIWLHSLCLSAHRRFPFGSDDEKKRNKAKNIIKKAIRLAHRLNIKIIQLAGYDVYYEQKSVLSRERFIECLTESVQEASRYGIILAIEIMDDPFINSVTKFMTIKNQIPSPFLQLYPDLGNLSAWSENYPAMELEKGKEHLVAIHLKDTYPVTTESTGKFRNVPFGKGCVDFLGLLKVLKRSGYEGAFLIEMWSGENAGYENEIQEAKDYLYPKLNEAGYHVE